MQSSWIQRHAGTARYELVLCAVLERPFVANKHRRSVAHCVRCSSGAQLLDREVAPATMTSRMHPPKQFLSEIGRRSVPVNGTHQTAGSGVDQQLAPFACGMTGTPAEVCDPQPCDIVGNFPVWLSGNLYRNGPGTFDVRTKDGGVVSLAHWYAGLLGQNKRVLTWCCCPHMFTPTQYISNQRMSLRLLPCG